MREAHDILSAEFRDSLNFKLAQTHLKQKEGATCKATLNTNVFTRTKRRDVLKKKDSTSAHKTSKQPVTDWEQFQINVRRYGRDAAKKFESDKVKFDAQIAKSTYRCEEK